MNPTLFGIAIGIGVVFVILALIYLLAPPSKAPGGW